MTLFIEDIDLAALVAVMARRFASNPDGRRQRETGRERMTSIEARCVPPTFPGKRPAARGNAGRLAT
jgi:hypothetical protein